MTLVQVWLALLLAFSEGYQCRIGTPITDWYSYWPAHEPVRVWELVFETESAKQQIHIFEDGAGEQYVFFYDPHNYPHGTCAVILPDHLKVVP